MLGTYEFVSVKEELSANIKIAEYVHLIRTQGKKRVKHQLSGSIKRTSSVLRPCICSGYFSVGFNS